MQKLSIFLTFQRFVESCKATTHIHTENPISGMSFLERQEKLHRFWQCKCSFLKHRKTIPVFGHVTLLAHMLITHVGPQQEKKNNYQAPIFSYGIFPVV